MNEFNGFNQIGIKDKIQEIWYKNKLYIIISLCLIIGLIIILNVINRGQSIDTSNLTYKSIETIMKNNAEEYAKNNKITKSTYLSLNVLNLKIDKDSKCETISGVLKESDNYYPYLVCDKYQSDKIKEIVDKNASNKSYGSLKGDNPYVLTSGEYIEPGYEIDNKYKVNIKGNNIENGVNIISYYILENNNYVAELKRIVIAEDITTTAPVIELVGNRTISVPQNSEYKDPGYKATDKTDGDITNKVKVTGSVDTKTPGTYKITYSVTNSKNKTATASRTVIVNKTQVTLAISHTINPTTQSENGVTITLDIKGNDYLKTILPNNTESTSANPTYVVYKNGTYEFVIFDNLNNSEVYSVKIINAIITYDITYNKNGGNSVPDKQTKYKNQDITLSSISPSYTDYTFLEWNTKADKTGISYKPGDIYKENNDLELYAIWIKNSDVKYWDSGLTAKVYRNNNGESMDYYFYAPPNTMTIKQMPLIIYLHGSGESKGQGDGTIKVLKSVSLPYLLAKGTTYNAIIVSPHTYGSGSYMKESGGTGPIKRFLDYIVSTYNIDPRKICVTGHSIGAKESIMLGRYYPNYFSCIVPVSGAMGTSYAQALTTVPIWGFTGTADGFAHPSLQQLINAINAAGGNAKITLLQGRGHSIQNEVYSNTELINWMISQTRK